jgi:hypothetical protein
VKDSCEHGNEISDSSARTLYILRSLNIYLPHLRNDPFNKDEICVQKIQ